MGTRPWARHEGYCGECGRLVPLVKRLVPPRDQPGIVGMVLVAHKRYARSGLADNVSPAECLGSGCLPEPEPDIEADLPHRRPGRDPSTGQRHGQAETTDLGAT
jgi:hypothetical protein